MNYFKAAPDELNVRLEALPKVSKHEILHDGGLMGSCLRVTLEGVEHECEMYADDNGRFAPNQERYLLAELAALLVARQVDATAHLSEVERLARDMRDLDLHANTEKGRRALAKALLEKGWKR